MKRVLLAGMAVLALAPSVSQSAFAHTKDTLPDNMVDEWCFDSQAETDALYRRGACKEEEGVKYKMVIEKTSYLNEICEITRVNKMRGFYQTRAECSHRGNTWTEIKRFFFSGDMLNIVDVREFNHKNREFEQ